MPLTTRPPTGAVPPPLVLLEGEEKAGKTYAALLLSASKRTGTTYVLDIGEGTADEYGSIPNVDYQIVEHDGTYHGVYEAVLEVRAEADRARKAGEPPVVLIVDSMTAVWSGLKDWASERAKGSAKNRKALAADPHAEVQVTSNLWNDAGGRHRRLMTALMTFPGIAVVTARGKDVVKFEDGQPSAKGERTWSVDAHKDVPYDATLWLRMRRGAPAEVVGCRSVHVGLRPGVDDPQSVTGDHDDDLLEWLIFDVLKYDPAAGAARNVQGLEGGPLTDEEAGREPIVTDVKWYTGVLERLEACTTAAIGKGLWAEVVGAVKAGKVHEKDYDALKAAFAAKAQTLGEPAEEAK